MNPFAQLVDAVTAKQRRVPEWAAKEQHGSLTDTLLGLLDCNGPMTTRDLCDAVGLTHTKLVWGLLKQHLDSGQVRYTAILKLWELNRDFPGRDVQRAADLLKSHGWTCIAPKQK